MGERWRAFVRRDREQREALRLSLSRARADRNAARAAIGQRVLGARAPRLSERPGGVDLGARRGFDELGLPGLTSAGGARRRRPVAWAVGIALTAAVAVALLRLA